MSSPARTAWPPTRSQLVVGGVGLAIGLSGVTEGSFISVLLRLVGYTVACTAIARWVPIVHERWATWFLAHEAAMAAICIGWATADRWVSLIPNGSWLVIAALWYQRGGLRRTVDAD